ncbi:hypothetical protein [Pelagicoccus sp. SDUM812003]|uniref:hypothetical protein n=1 Tax=Pelagicoccus sp. SDUM812003 TaxID=3041267 RepID=UPI00280C756C|nr:hypothetical protein [Pelagicoccus sp. SDUM812003]MDQ8202285.1 hypothetical protein [Pelagicoccus sp. SDUM812003]
MNDEPNTPAKKTFESLADCVVRYDMGKLLDEARAEFETVVTNRELIDQDNISELFNEGN